MADKTSVTAGGVKLTATIKSESKVNPDNPLEQFKKLLHEAMLEAARRVVIPALQATIATQGPPPSSPLYPPHRQTAEQHDASAPFGIRPLIESLDVGQRRNGDVEIICANMYGLFLEIGTQDMAPRPWIVWTLTRPDVIQEFTDAVYHILNDLMASSGSNGPPATPP